jgi:hypothetical protein
VNASQSNGNTSGAVPAGWIGTNNSSGFGWDRRGIVDESHGDFTDPVGEQAFATRYTNSGLTSAEGEIGVLAADTTYIVSFDVVLDGHNNTTPYNVGLVVFDTGANRGDTNPFADKTLGVLASASGNAPGNGRYATVTFAYTTDSIADAALIGKDLAVRIGGATSSAIIDNIKVISAATPSVDVATVTIAVSGVNDTPVVSLPIPDVTIYTSSPSLDIPLFPVFDDVDGDDVDTALTYTVTANTNTGLVTPVAVNSADGILRLNTPCSLSGTADITVRATDTKGAWVEYTFEVTVDDNIYPVISCAKDIVVTVPEGGTTDEVFYTPIGYDACEGDLIVTCSPPSGTSGFAVGSNTVNCSVTDSGGNLVLASFEIIVIEQQDVASTRYLDGVSLRGEAASGAGLAAGATILQVNNAFLNNNGDVAFDATLLGNGTNNAAVFLRPAGGSPAPVAVKGSAFGTGSYGIFSYLSLNDDGNIGFQSLTSGSLAGHFVDTGAGPAASAIRQKTAPTGVAGENFNVIYQPALASDGELLTPGTLMLGGPSAVSIANDGLITSSAGGGTVIMREGDAEPNGLPNTLIGQHLSRVVASNTDGHYAFPCYLYETPLDKATNMAVYTGVLGGAPPAVAVRKGDAAAGTAGGSFDYFVGESVNSDGELALRAYAAGAGISAADNEGVWTNSGNTSGPPVLVAREGDVAPCIAGGLAAFAGFRTVYMGDDGSVYFLAYLKNATAAPAIHAGNDASVWVWRNGVLDILAREGELANNTDGSVIARIGNLDCSGTGGIVYAIEYVPNIGDATWLTNQAVYVDRGAADLAPLLVLRRGDKFDNGGTEVKVASLRISTVTTASGSTGGYGRSINDAGEVLLNIGFTGSTGLFVLGTPPP